MSLTIQILGTINVELKFWCHRHCRSEEVILKLSIHDNMLSDQVFNSIDLTLIFIISAHLNFWIIKIFDEFILLLIADTATELPYIEMSVLVSNSNHKHTGKPCHINLCIMGSWYQSFGWYYKFKFHIVSPPPRFKLYSQI